MVNFLKKLVDKIFKINFNDIISFDFPENELCGLEILLNNVKYEFLVKKSNKSDKIICFGGRGGVDQSKRKLPDFPRHSWRNNFVESLIYYADPTFHVNKEIRNGWYMGTKDDWYLEKIALILEEIEKNFKIKNENTLFYGTSAGGYSSLVLATLIKGSTALVGNAQIIISNHYKGHYNTLKKYCFDDLDEKTLLKKYGYRLNLLELFKRENYVPHFTYFVNVESKIDLNKHCFPLMRGLQELPNFNGNDVEIILYHDERGHTARNERELAIPLIKLYLDRKVYNYYEDATILNKALISFDFENKDKIIIEQQRTIEKLKSKRIFKIENKVNSFFKKIF